MSDKRPSLATDDNQPKLREPKAPFGLARKRWNRIQLRLFMVAAVFAAVLALWLISRRNQQVDAHRIQGERLAPYYAVVSEVIGCDSPVTREADEVFIGVHQGFPPGPVLVECHHPQECATVSQRDPSLGQPAAYRGALEDVIWADWATPPSILMDQEGAWVGAGRRAWRVDAQCHVVERREVLALEDGQLTQTVEIRHGAHECADAEPALDCVYRRVRQLRASRD